MWIMKSQCCSVSDSEPSPLKLCRQRAQEPGSQNQQVLFFLPFKLPEVLHLKFYKSEVVILTSLHLHLLHSLILNPSSSSSLVFSENSINSFTLQTTPLHPTQSVPISTQPLDIYTNNILAPISWFWKSRETCHYRQQTNKTNTKTKNVAVIKGMHITRRFSGQFSFKMAATSRHVLMLR